MYKGEDYTGVVIVFFCHDGKGNILMSKRNSNCRDEHDRWDIGGGALEYGDTVEDTLCKEIKEEYCVDILTYEFLGHREIHRSDVEKKSHWIALDFKVKVDPKGAKNGEPHKFDAVDWFTLSTLPHPKHSQLPAFLEKYANKLS